MTAAEGQGREVAANRRTRRWFLRVAAVVAAGGAALVFTLRDDLSRWLGRRREEPEDERPIVTLEDAELAELALVAAILAGIPVEDRPFAEYARMRLQEGAQRVIDVGDALRTALAFVRESAGTALASLDPPGRCRVVGALVARSRARDHDYVRRAVRVLLRVALNSPASWARLGYRQFPGVLGDFRAVQFPPAA